MVRIVVNGKLEDLDGPMTISQYLSRKGVKSKTVVERNLEIVRRDAYDSVMIEDGDELEVVQMMAGG